tara:strand:+ start:304 stop:522 length:219 start_codon:yes stop_codon:yes gene_type:complete
MKYSKQTQLALDRLDESLARLQGLIKKNQNSQALQFMNEELKERYEDLQNIITLSSVGTAGSVRNIPNTGHL